MPVPDDARSQGASCHNQPPSELSEGLNLMNGKLDSLGNTVAKVLEAHEQSLSLLTDKMAGLHAQLGSLKDDFAMNQKAMRKDLFLGSNDSMNFSIDNLAQSYSLQSEEPMVG